MSESGAGRWTALTVICIGVVGALTTWFSATAIIPELQADWRLSAAQSGWMTNAVQLGFVIGALGSSLVNIPDLVRMNRLMAVSSLVAACANAGLGVLIGVISSSSRVTGLWSQLIFLPSMLIGGLMMPYSMLPETAQTFGRLLPAAHAMNAFQALSMGYEPQFSPEGSLAILITGGLVAFGLAVYLFNWDRRNQTRRGHPLMALLAAVPYIIGVVVL